MDAEKNVLHHRRIFYMVTCNDSITSAAFGNAEALLGKGHICCNPLSEAVIGSVRSRQSRCFTTINSNNPRRIWNGHVLCVTCMGVTSACHQQTFRKKHYRYFFKFWSGNMSKPIVVKGGEVAKINGIECFRLWNNGTLLFSTITLAAEDNSLCLCERDPDCDRFVLWTLRLRMNILQTVLIRETVQ